MKVNKIRAEEFDSIFDKNDEDIMQYADMSLAKRPHRIKRVNVDFPLWLVEALDKEAQRIGVTRQSLIKIWLSDKLERQGV